MNNFKERKGYANIISNVEKARKIIYKSKKTGNSLPCFCIENVMATEAIFMGAKKLLWLSDFKEGLLAVRDDIERIARNQIQFNDIDVIVHLDHAQADDGD